jgi:predicted RNA-binding protein YlqC (UPF0109 family)
MRDLIDNILKALSNHPDKIMLTELYGRQTIILEVRCHSDDMGRIIGKNGKTIGALRTLFGVLAAKQRRRGLLEIVE